jgi:hypothetical protein
MYKVGGRSKAKDHFLFQVFEDFVLIFVGGEYSPEHNIHAFKSE